MTYYYADSENKPLGPFTLDQMREFAQQGILVPTTRVIAHGSQTWSTWAAISQGPTAGSSGPYVPPAMAGPALTDTLAQYGKSLNFQVPSVQGVGGVSLLFGLLLALIELFVLPSRLVLRSLKDLSKWGQAAALPVGDTDIPTLTYYAVVQRPLTHVFVTIFFILNGFYEFCDQVYRDHSANGFLMAVYLLFGSFILAYFFNLLIGLFFESFGLWIGMANHLRKIAEKKD